MSCMKSVRMDKITCSLKSAKRSSDIEDFCIFFRPMLRYTGSSCFWGRSIGFLSQMNVKYFLFLSLIRHIPENKRSILMSVREYHYIKCDDHITCESL